eukprot:TRINITY_DN35481_c0_g1_i1.p1 TRINITY_DN35481_c0_g1~~TRINITY_DN35481_c0_g1_i1.p1  ORF type:complete len:113 (+),score=22.87 TRINITY_DN35481_c0_g1_i1:63-401(+)
MVLPLQLLKNGITHPINIEMKGGETYNGYLKSCDDWMNVHLVDVNLTSSDGERFFKLKECFIRGNTIKYIRQPEAVLRLAEEAAAKQKKNKRSRKRPREDEGGGGGKAKKQG